MKLKNESIFVGELTTIGRRTGLARTVELRMVYLNGKFYAASRRVQGKYWCRNMLKNPDVNVKAGGELFSLPGAAGRRRRTSPPCPQPARLAASIGARCF
jgi:hypothetical protein